MKHALVVTTHARGHVQRPSFRRKPESRPGAASLDPGFRRDDVKAKRTPVGEWLPLLVLAAVGCSATESPTGAGGGGPPEDTAAEETTSPNPVDENASADGVTGGTITFTEYSTVAGERLVGTYSAIIAGDRCTAADPDESWKCAEGATETLTGTISGTFDVEVKASQP